MYNILQKIKSGAFIGIGIGIGLCMSYAFAVTVGTLNTFSSGETVSSSLINANFNTLKTAIESLNTETQTALQTVAICYTSDNGQSIPTNAYTIVKFEDKDYDTHNAYDTSTGIWTCPQTGYYIISAQVLFQSSGTNHRHMRIYKNNIVVSSGNALTASVSSSNQGYAELQDELYLSNGDQITIQVHQDSGAALGLIVASEHNVLRIRKVDYSL
ncbi:MAG: hypothetical protein AAF518_04885 [Spirochaetota bacterium]